MKAIYTILCVLFASFLNGQTLIQVQDFSAVTIPDFPSGFAPATGASLNWNTSIQSSDTIARCPRGGGSGVTYVLVTQTFSSVGFVNVIFSFNRRAQGTTSGSNALRKIFVEWSNNNGGTWFTVDSVSATTGAFSTYNSSTLGATADGNSTLKFRFTLGASTAAANIANAFWIDDIAIKGDLTSATEFFSKSSGLLDDLTTWGSNTNGSGTQPISFNEPDYIFHVANNNAATIANDLVVDGTNAQFIIESGANFIIPNGLLFDPCASCAVIDINTGGTLTIQNLTLTDYPKIGSLAIGSTIGYGGAGNQTVLGSPIVYENLTIAGSGNKTCEAGKNVRVNGSLSIATGNTLVLHKTTGNTSNFNLFGSNAGSGGDIDGNIHSRLIIDGVVSATGNLKFKTGAIIGILDFQATNTVLAVESNLNVSNLRFSNAPNLSILQILGASKLTISGEVNGDPKLSGGTDAELEINGSGVNNINLNLQIDVGDPFLNAFKNFTLNKNINVTLSNEMKVLNDVTIIAGTLISNGNLTLYSDANSTGRILALNPPTSDVTGNVKINRFNAGGFTGWVTMASPVKGITFTALDDDIAVTCPSCPDGTGSGGSDFTSVYSYDETQSGPFDDFNSYAPLADITESFRNGTGYYVYFGDGNVTSGDITFDVTGPIASEEVRLPLTSTPGFNGATFDDVNDGVNLVGNPYPAPLDWVEVFNTTSADALNGADPIFDAYYIYSADENGGSGGFYTWVEGSQTPGLIDDGIIPLGQAFFVQTQGPAGRTVDLVINESCKSGTNTPFYLKTAYPSVTKKQDCYLKLTRYSDAKATSTTVTFKAAATTNLDPKYDGLYKSALPVELSVNPKTMIFYTLLNGTKYSINALPPVNGQLKLDLFTKVGTTGMYSISANNLTAIPAGYCIDLFDKNTNTHHDLKMSDYMCTLDKNDNQSRFELTFSNTTFKITTIGSEPLCNSAATGEMTVKVKEAGVYTYTWRDANNQIVAQTNNSNVNSHSVKNLIGGTYKVEVSKQNQCSVASEEVTIQGSQSAIANFTIPENVSIGTNGQASVTFNNLSQQATNYIWDFGDGKKVNAQSDYVIRHNYAKPGVYKVSLEVSNDNCTDVAKISKYISVQDPSGLALNITKTLEQSKIWKDANDNLHLVFDNIVGTGSIEIYNLVGQKLFDYALKNNLNKEIIIKNISETITQQIGIVKLKSSTNQVTKRIAF